MLEHTFVLRNREYDLDTIKTLYSFGIDPNSNILSYYIRPYITRHKHVPFTSSLLDLKGIYQ